jgi:hypothetical protein
MAVTAAAVIEPSIWKCWRATRSAASELVSAVSLAVRRVADVRRMRHTATAAATKAAARTTTRYVVYPFSSLLGRVTQRPAMNAIVLPTSSPAKSGSMLHSMLLALAAASTFA